MSTSRRSLSGVGIERKRASLMTTTNAHDLSAIPESPYVSTSAHSIQPLYSATQSYSQSEHRPPSPPASSYFPSVSKSQSGEPQPAPGASDHFAYSTTLRRHHNEGSLSLSLPLPQKFPDFASAEGLWHKAVTAVTGHQRTHEDDVLENGYALVGGRVSPPPAFDRDDRRETPSARFAHCTVEDTIAHFRTSATSGLSVSSISTLQNVHGYNEFSVSTPEPVLIKFAKTIYESPLILLLCASAAISAVMGNVDDAVSIAVAVFIVLTVGFIQEQRSEKSLEALNKLVPHHCHVVRDGQSIHVLANELVPGDIVTLATGDRVPADLRVISAVDFEIDESSLTGETNARTKDASTCAFERRADGVAEPVALAERSCIAYMGTLVRNGRGSGVVIATGTQTEFGVIFSMMQDVEEKRTPLQLSMDELAKKLSILSFGIIGIICVIGMWQQRPWLDMFTIGVSLAVAAIPEGLPIVTTVTLALGVLRMSNRKAIVKKLHSVEALGSVSVICSDKTGTLTMNEQTVTEIYVVDEMLNVDAPHLSSSISPAVRKVLEIGSLCNNASQARNADGVFSGQSTDVALLNILSQFQVPDPRPTFTRLSERPFNSEQKYMAVSGFHSYSAALYSGSPREIYYIKGSIDAIIERCKFYYVADGSTPTLDASTRNVILTNAQSTASRGLRVIAMAYGYGSVESAGPDLSSPPHLTHRSSQSMPATRPPTPDKEKTNLVFVGFQAMLDPPRKGVADAIGLLQSAGIQIVMITGDAEQTALAIAQKLGLQVGPRRTTPGHINRYCLTGKDIDQMTKAQLVERVGSVSVFARTTPRHKMAIVEAFQTRGAVVAMTGDGVNDAPALKMADIGVSMGKSGTDVAKEAADVILVDDNFSTILPAVEEGKSIFHNIQNFLSFQLSTAAAALTLITLSTFFGFSNPLNAMQILFINILMDGPPSQSLGVDPVDLAVMRKPPRKKNEPIITNRLLYRVLFSAATIVCGTAFIYTTALDDDLVSRREQTMTFTCFVFLDLVSAVQSRGLGCGIAQNKMLVTTVSVSLFVQLTLVYVPFMQAIFQTEALSMRDLATLILLAATSFALHEGRRRFERALNEESSYASVMEEMA
ncbi:calcium-transporting P [Leucogyrophana mollusca]|uniref:Calcium-transporting P n=1 Tax=Leucogyrophana mollusca TaxID=85980 RepID=A0ACB8B1V9_9AGAM|nr:calcium-transporting P [Leucogyrophana mollusca]